MFNRATKRFKMTDPWPRGAEPWTEPVEHSAWNRNPRSISFGVGLTAEARIEFPEPESVPLKTLPVSHP